MARLLIIEDEPLLLSDVVELLTYAGFEAFGATTGTEGLRLLPEVQPDLVLCDMMMPELDGHQVLRAIRANPATAKLPFIFLSAVTDPTTRETSLAEGANLYLTKPFTHTDLIEAINACLETV
ncbi:MAG TPA: response regulator [Oceanobacillus sp.]|nr:response regulator [Oceanobacillus sp.]